jgi:hypothetical protein
MYTTATTTDGFGAQYQKIIQTYILCKHNKLEFAYKPFIFVEHNYNNDTEYVNKLEKLINLKDNVINANDSTELDYNIHIRHQFEANIDFFCESEHMKFIQQCFWKNKDRHFYKNDKINVAVHIRKENSHDNGLAGERATTPNSYYLNVMNQIRKKYGNVLFHIYSQGKMTDFQQLIGSDVLFYLNHDIIKTFIGMVAANVLVISPSSFSYVAGLISDGVVYYKPFWHKPRRNWICVN